MGRSDAQSRYRNLRKALYSDNQSFKRWFTELKRCYPLPEWMLAELIETDLAKFWQLRNGRCRPNRRMMTMIGYLIGFRIGAFNTVQDLFKVRRLMHTGELQRMIDECLAKEGKAELKRRQREALKYAQERGEL